MPDPKRQLQGMKSKAQGAAFEKRLEDSFAYYRNRGIAYISKESEPVHYVKTIGNGKFIAFYERKSKPDFSGVIKGGRAVLFEAKYTSSTKMEYSRVEDHQSAYLTKCQELGARCFVICGFSSGNAYLVPWYIWQQMKELYGRKYVTEQDLSKYKIPVGANGTLFVLDDK